MRAGWCHIVITMHNIITHEGWAVSHSDYITLHNIITHEGWAVSHSDYIT